MKKMRIVLKKDGTQEIEVLDAQGSECVEFTDELEKRLGKPDGERQLKPEFDEEVLPAESEGESEWA